MFRLRIANPWTSRSTDTVSSLGYSLPHLQKTSPLCTCLSSTKAAFRFKARWICLRSHRSRQTPHSTKNRTYQDGFVSLPPSTLKARIDCTTVQHAFPDSGASICLANFNHILQMNLSPSDLLPSFKRVTAVGGSTINCTRWLPIKFSINGNSSKQPVFVCDEVDRIYVGRQACIDLHILLPCYPHPMPPTPKSDESHRIEGDLPERPSCLPFLATNENISNLKNHLIENFNNTVFNKSGALPAMETIPAHIHLKEEATPHAHHVPIPVPYHWKKQVKADLDLDVERGIIQPVSIGTPVSWCSKMIVTPKKER